MLSMLDSSNPEQSFPDVENALENPDGLLAMGGCLSTQRLKNAYRHGVFPWFNDGDPILWWSPNPRLILAPSCIKLSRSLRKLLSREDYSITFDKAFYATIKACSLTRAAGPGTWITDSMISAYTRLHDQGIAHSVEAWYGDELAGGLYGVAIGRVFFGESMFFRRSNASKVAFARFAHYLERWNYALIDCQVQTDHLARFGARQIERNDFIELLNVYCDQRVSELAWSIQK